VSNHTPEPWKVLPHESVVFIMAGGYANGTTPASAATPCVACCDRYCHGPADEVQANGDRIVACVNALAGIPNPAAEMARLRAVEESWKELRRACSIASIAMKEAWSDSEGGQPVFQPDDIEPIDTALASAAKVGGGA
jgi:hypothetical protein